MIILRNFLLLFFLAGHCVPTVVWSSFCDRLVYREIGSRSESVYARVDTAGSFFLAPLMTQNSCNGVPIYKKEGDDYYMFKTNEQRDTDYMCEMFVPSNVVACQAECEEVRFKMSDVYVSQRDRNGVQGAMPEEFDATYSSWRPKVMDRVYCADQIQPRTSTSSSRPDIVVATTSSNNVVVARPVDSFTDSQNKLDDGLMSSDASSNPTVVADTTTKSPRISAPSNLPQSKLVPVENSDQVEIVQSKGEELESQRFDQQPEIIETTTESSTTSTTTTMTTTTTVQTDINNGLVIETDHDTKFSPTDNQKSQFSSFADLSPFYTFQMPPSLVKTRPPATTTTSTQQAWLISETTQSTLERQQQPQIQNSDDQALIEGSADSLSRLEKDYSYIQSTTTTTTTTTMTSPVSLTVSEECDRIGIQILERGATILNFTLSKYFGVNCVNHHLSTAHMVYFDPVYHVYLYRQNHDAHYCLDKLDEFVSTDHCHQACKDLRLGPMGLASPLDTEFIVVLNDQSQTILSDDYKISCIQDTTLSVKNSCASEPCHNGATCSESDNSHGFLCTCKPRYTGLACETYEYEPCREKKFGEFAPHEEPGMFYVCLGRRSGENIVHKCPAGLVYNDLAQRCEYNDIQSLMDESEAKCAINICQNGGLCEVVDRKIKCMCPIGFSGEYCEINTDDCPGKCGPNGRCVDLINGWVCLCDQDNMYGSDCALNKIPNPCKIDSLRSPLTASITRDLQLTRHFYQFDPSVIVECSFSGEIHLNRCPSDLYWDPVSAHCIYHYQTLSQRQIEDLECHDVVCFNNGKCKVNSITLRPQCDCPTGFKGDFCELNINECASNPCEQQAECVDLINDYYCVCGNKFLDKDCQAVSITRNPCNQPMNGKGRRIIRHAHPFTNEKFIVCNLEGYAQVVSCPVGLVWVQEEHTCRAPDEQLLLSKQRQCGEARRQGITRIAYHYSMFKYIDCGEDSVSDVDDDDVAAMMVVRSCPKETPLFCAIKQACVKHYLIDCLFKPAVI